mgnify:CR=1 FL=1
MARTLGARGILLALLVGGAFVVLIGLGTWQLQRLAWKEALIAAANERPLAAAVAPPGPDAWPAFDIDAWNYRRVRLTGHYGPGESYAWTALADPKGGDFSGPGYFVVAPFVLADGFTVLVNRGFVPDSRKDPASRPESLPPAGETTVEGIVRRNDPPSFVTPAPDPATGIWFTRDIPTMAAFLDVSGPIAPYSVDLVATETPPGGLPQAGESQISFPNSHLQYALTWYGIAAALAGVVIAALSAIGFYLAPNFWMWFPLRVVFHGAVTIAFILSEYWINALAPDARRGFVMGIYATVLSIGFATGPAILNITGTSGLLPFVAGAILLVIAAVPMLLARADEPPRHGEETSLPILAYLVAAPLGTLAGLVFGAVEQGALSLLPIFGIRVGFGPPDAALLVSAVALGNVLLQIPLGIAADRYDRRWLLLACAAVGTGGALLMPPVSGSFPTLLLVLFVWGGFIAGLYTIGLTHLGARYRGKALAGANAAFVMMYSTGMLIGPTMMGAGLTTMGPAGLPYACAFLFAVFAAVALYRIWSDRARNPA